MRFWVVFFGFIPCAHAYLDPGTSSLLLSSAVAIFASIVYFLKSIFYRILTGQGVASLMLQSRKNKSAANHQSLIPQNSIVIYSEGRQYYGVFKPILDVFEAHQCPYTFYTSDEHDPILEFQSKIGHIECIGNNNRAYARLNTLQADIVLMTTPQLDVLQIKRSKGVKHYCHILHSPGSVDFYEIFALDCFDSVLTNSVIHTEFIREVERIRHLPAKQIEIVGLTYLDYLSNQLNRLHLDHLKQKENPTILLAPSWGRNALFAKYGMRLLKPLLETGYGVIIRPHPQSYISQKELLEELKSQTQSYENCRWDNRTDNIYAMAESDIIIGDFSGALWDYLLLFNKPILTVHFQYNIIGYDLEDTNREKHWAESALEEVSILIEEQDFSNIKNIIDVALHDIDKKENRERMKEILWQHPGKSAENVFRSLLKIRQNILKESLGEQIYIYQQICAVENMLQKI